MSSSADAPWTVRRLLEWTTEFFNRRAVDSPRLSAELLLSHVLSAPRIKLYTNYEQMVSPHHLTTYRQLVKRAAEQEPIGYLTGRAHFFNLEFDVSPAVLIPRPETETLVENIIQFLRSAPGFESPRILDLCTGSGCIAAAVAHHWKAATVVASDVSESALEIAGRNIEKLKLNDRVTLRCGDLFAALTDTVDAQPFHLIVANPPYIASADIPTLDRNVRDYEPLEALDGGMDGMAPHRQILAGAADHLLPAGRVFLEIAYDQGPLALQIASGYPTLSDARILRDYAGHDRVLTARKSD